MRITGGDHCGRKLFLPKTLWVRPPSDKVRQALFNMLPALEGKTFLDLFAGSGSVGIEALSRGAQHCTFIEVNTTYLRKNLNPFNRSSYSIIRGKLPQALRKVRAHYDIIYVDPPFEYEGFLEKTIETFKSLPDMCTENSLLIVRQNVRCEKTLRKGLHILKEKIYGESRLFFYERVKEQN